MKTAILASVLILVFVTASPAQEKSPKTLTEGFFRLLMEDKAPQAYDNVFAGSPVPKLRPEESSVMREQTRAALAANGKILGYELIREEKFGDSVLQLVYLLRSEVIPTVWQFVFYKPKAEWYLLGVTFFDDANGLDAMR
ncbi:MAG: hypothetical protein ABSE25_00075 [Syntrophorhabdales bacterium]|jgi:hypothetical protein